MSQVILTNWTIFFADDAPAASSGMKQITWTGGGGPEDNTNTVNDLYSEIMHYFSIPGNNDADDTTPMKAVTPVRYEIGRFDSGDLEAWFIDPVSAQHLTGGSIQTVGWTRVADSFSGIVKVAYTPTTNQFVASDIGRTVTHDDGDTGILLWFDSTNNEAWIRPTDATSTNNWDSGANDFVATLGTGDVTQTATAVTGERLWSNERTIGTLEDNTRIFVAQANTEISNFWGDGDAIQQINRLFLVNDGFDAGLINKGLLTTYARQYSKLYDHFIADLSGGGQVPVPLSTSDDKNNTSGNRTVTVTGASSAFSIDEVVTGGTSGAKGVVTVNIGNPTTSFDYYLIDDLTDFNASETLSGSIVGANGSTNGAPADDGPALNTGVTITFGEEDASFNTGTGVNGTTEVITTAAAHGFSTEDEVDYTKDGGTAVIGLTEGTLYYARSLSATTLSLHASAADAASDTARIDLTAAGAETHRLVRSYDFDENGTGESYSIIINCDSLDLPDLYERLKHITRRGETATLNGIEGQQYIGTNYRIDYNALTGTIDTGNTLTQLLADGTTTTTVVQKHHTIDGFLMLRDTDGDLEVGAGAANLQIDGSNFVTMTGGATAEIIQPVRLSPFGTLAGGRFFGARGVYLENFDSSELNNIELIDDGGPTRTSPIVVTFQLTGLQSNSEVRLCDSDVADGDPSQEIAGTESSGTTFSYQYTYVGDVNAHVIIHHLNYQWQRISGLVLSTSDQSIPVQQQRDRNFSNP